MSKAKELVGNEAAAAYVGLSVNSWRPYVARGQAPKPDKPYRVVDGHVRPVWSARILDEWKANRPGQGARTDRRDVPWQEKGGS